VARQANAEYLIDGYVAYSSNATADLKMTLSAPSGSTAHWVSRASTPASHRRAPWTQLKALLHGYIDTACTAGNLQTRMAQNTANASKHDGDRRQLDSCAACGPKNPSGWQVSACR
jgi:hypothetical protein